MIADAALLAELGAVSFRESVAAESDANDLALYLAEAFGVAQQRCELLEPGSVFVIAEIDAAAIGYARLRARDLPQPLASSAIAAVELARIYVRRAEWGRGVGAALLAATLDAARERDAGLIWLGVWERNARAIAFYEKAGFTKVGRKIFQLGHDAQHDWVMARLLAG